VLLRGGHPHRSRRPPEHLGHSAVARSPSGCRPAVMWTRLALRRPQRPGAAGCPRGRDRGRRRLAFTRGRQPARPEVERCVGERPRRALGTSKTERAAARGRHLFPAVVGRDPSPRLHPPSARARPGLKGVKEFHGGIRCAPLGRSLDRSYTSRGHSCGKVVDPGGARRGRGWRSVSPSTWLGATRWQGQDVGRASAKDIRLSKDASGSRFGKLHRVVGAAVCGRVWRILAWYLVLSTVAAHEQSLRSFLLSTYSLPSRQSARPLLRCALTPVFPRGLACISCSFPGFPHLAGLTHV